jgi:hypothetical protein
MSWTNRSNTLLQFRRVASESHRGEENCYITSDNCFGYLAASIRFHTHSRCFDPTVEATETVRQFRLPQWKDLDSSRYLQHLGQHAKDWS